MLYNCVESNKCEALITERKAVKSTQQKMIRGAVEHFRMTINIHSHIKCTWEFLNCDVTLAAGIEPASRRSDHALKYAVIKFPPLFE